MGIYCPYTFKDRILYDISHAECKKICMSAIKKLQSFKRENICVLEGLEEVLDNVWDAVCYIVQTQWDLDFYQDAIDYCHHTFADDFISKKIDALPNYIKTAIWWTDYSSYDKGDWKWKEPNFLYDKPDMCRYAVDYRHELEFLHDIPCKAPYIVDYCEEIPLCDIKEYKQELDDPYDIDNDFFYDAERINEYIWREYVLEEAAHYSNERISEAIDC